MDLVGIGNRLKDIRKKLNLRQKEFAESLGITMVTLSDIETGKKQPGGCTLYNLSKLCDVNLDFLLHGIGSMFRQVKEIDGVTIEDNAFGILTNEVREMLWYMRNSSLARFAFITLAKEYIYRNRVILSQDINLQKEKNERENDGAG